MMPDWIFSSKTLPRGQVAMPKRQRTRMDFSPSFGEPLEPRRDMQAARLFAIEEMLRQIGIQEILEESGVELPSRKVMD